MAIFCTYSLENQSRRNNLRINRINKKENETWDECQKENQILIKDKLGIDENNVIEQAHQIKKKRNSENPGKHIIIVRQFFNYKNKANIFKNIKNLEGKNIFINEDFSHENMELRKALWEKVKKQWDKGVVKRRNNQSLS